MKFFIGAFVAIALVLAVIIYPDRLASPLRAVAVVEPRGGSAVRGMVTFEKAGENIVIRAEITGLTPGKHGFHIHEYGDISCGEGKCTSGHFNPFGKAHGSPSSKKRHAGDFGNLEADSSGRAVLERLDPNIALSGKKSIIGRAVVIHADPDDLQSQPSGNAGARIGVGVVGLTAANE